MPKKREEIQRERDFGDYSQRIGLWGKLSKNDAGGVIGWLPLIDHCVDVACVFRALVDLPIYGRVLEASAGHSFSSGQLDRLAVVAFLHDIGKCNHGFQAKADPTARNTAGHVREVWPLFMPPLNTTLMEALRLKVIAEWFCHPEQATAMLLASISHHGKPVDPDDLEKFSRRDSLWQSGNGRNPLEDLDMLGREALALFPRATQNVRSINACPALQHRFAGLVMLADWLGSDAERFFPYKHGVGSRADFARTQARRALLSIGLDASQYRTTPGRGNHDFKSIFGFAPNRLQHALWTSGDQWLHIAESDTGSGKTEAALGHFFQLYAAGRVDSLYFALPTRVAARELYRRVCAFARAGFGETYPPVLLAVPGYAAVDGEPVAALPSSSHLWHDDAELRRRERAWASERPKRFLAAPISVGTIDQALLSVMQSNHAHLRSVCLDRALLVVDEVHASDTYMRALLQSLLAHHRRVGGRALLLSATLGSDARAQFMTPPDRHHAAPPFAQALDLPYPSLTDGEGRVSDLSQRESMGDTKEARREKTVAIEPVAAMERPETLFPRITKALEAGARVLVVLNTVGRVMVMQRCAEADPEVSRMLLRCEGVICCHHGRFASRDRLVLDAAVSAALGKNSPNGAQLLIGSQTLEQSLDIDADWLITDLCPMDVLLQRVGRLHRHERSRPPGFESARCTVLVPEDPSLETYLGRQRSGGALGLGSVYPDLRVLQLTRDLIAEGRMIDIPRENRQLVESATHPERLDSLEGPEWTQHGRELIGGLMVQGDAAMRIIMPENDFAEGTAFGALAAEEAVRTRLGLDDRRIPLAAPVQSPFGQILHDITIPGWLITADATNSDLDAPPEFADGVLRFHYGGRAFRYSRLGLEVDQ